MPEGVERVSVPLVEADVMSALGTRELLVHMAAAVGHRLDG